ncbi:MAG: RNA methyltransferase [Saprospirales bacterium]|nr:RNA methyltransferase [Saprospirales bacterium]
MELILAISEWIEENQLLLQSCNRPVEPVTQEVLQKISSLQTPNKVYLLVEMDPAIPDAAQVANGLSLYLDGIQDPGNLGTILRIADWFGLAAVFCAPHCVEWANPKVIQASMGSFFRMPVEYLPLTDLVARFPELPVLGTAMDGDSIYTAPLSSRSLLVIGSESTGISEETGTLVRSWIGIPPYGNSSSESLNAAVATGIVCALIRGRSTGIRSIPD